MALLVRPPNDRIDVCDADLPGVEDGDTDTVYTVRPLTRETIKAIEAKPENARTTFNRITHQKETVYDDEAILLDKIDHVIADWRGVIYKETREPVPCTRENKANALDWPRVLALLRLASVNEVSKEDRDRSFRRPA
jgi:hypothetical protein